MTEAAAWADGQTCRDAVAVPLPLELNPDARGGVEQLVIASSSGGDDPLRTHCEGPDALDAFPDESGVFDVSGGLPSLAQGTLTAAPLLGAAPARIVLAAGSPEASPAYTVNEAGSLTFTLTPDGPPVVLVKRERVP